MFVWLYMFNFKLLYKGNYDYNVINSVSRLIGKDI